MANSGVSKAARKAAREAAAAAQEEQVRRQKANVEDLAKYFTAKQRVDEVAEWLRERTAELAARAAQRRERQRRECGVALKAMQDRGESVREIARLAGISEKAVRELIRAGASEAEAPATSVEAPSGSAATGELPERRAEPESPENAIRVAS
ncbi:hypothetical protein H7J71_01020 [Mycolicibacterium peregrinum]|uniref:hypothetical protein n=1 Tax=Mycolicibacterium peregrinum TaxID=43304 RepID=UPI00105581EE|nr:hypothetical protein [Mycolicibacterium peregrinum]MCV7200593.1 hypothetical protein [Mycolicibacterium peregrinum]